MPSRDKMLVVPGLYKLRKGLWGFYLGGGGGGGLEDGHNSREA